VEIDGDREVVELTRKLKGHDGPVTVLRLLQNRDLLLSCSRDGTVRVWDWAAGVRFPRILRDMDDDVMSILLHFQLHCSAYGRQTDNRI
jgi:WD40 repeat protein